jgi:hypothetical protein
MNSKLQRNELSILTESTKTIEHPQYPKVVLPWSHHLGTIGRLVVENSVVHPKGKGGKLFLPLDG